MLCEKIPNMGYLLCLLLIFGHSVNALITVFVQLDQEMASLGMEQSCNSRYYHGPGWIFRSMDSAIILNEASHYSRLCWCHNLPFH